MPLVLVWDELCQEGRAGSSTSQPRAGKEKQSRAHSVQVLSLLPLPSCDFAPYCPCTPCPHFFYSTMTPDSPRRSSLPGFERSLISAAVPRCPSPRPPVSLSQEAEGEERCASPGCCHREGFPRPYRPH